MSWTHSQKDAALGMLMSDDPNDWWLFYNSLNPTQEDMVEIWDLFFERFKAQYWEAFYYNMGTDFEDGKCSYWHTWLTIMPLGFSYKENIIRIYEPDDIFAPSYSASIIMEDETYFMYEFQVNEECHEIAYIDYKDEEYVSIHQVPKSILTKSPLLRLRKEHNRIFKEFKEYFLSTNNGETPPFF